MLSLHFILVVLFHFHSNGAQFSTYRSSPKCTVSYITWPVSTYGISSNRRCPQTVTAVSDHRTTVVPPTMMRRKSTFLYKNRILSCHHMTQHLSRNLVFGRAPDLSSTFSSLIGVWTNVGLPLMVIRLQIRGPFLFWYITMSVCP